MNQTPPVVIPDSMLCQVHSARAVIEIHLGPTLQALHLLGSAVDGRLRPASDIDLLVTISEPLDETVRQALMRALLTVSAPAPLATTATSRTNATAADAANATATDTEPSLRPLEVTVISTQAVLPWRYPARRELQFGEWLRDELLADVFEPPVRDPDLAILLTKVREHSLALFGPLARDLFDPVPEADRLRAFADALASWQSPPDWAGDERNVVLTLARIWYSVATGRIASKDAAADWVLARPPAGSDAVSGRSRAARRRPAARPGCRSRS